MINYGSVAVHSVHYGGTAQSAFKSGALLKGGRGWLGRLVVNDNSAPIFILKAIPPPPPFVGNGLPGLCCLYCRKPARVSERCGEFTAPTSSLPPIMTRIQMKNPGVTKAIVAASRYRCEFHNPKSRHGDWNDHKNELVKKWEAIGMSTNNCDGSV